MIRRNPCRWWPKLSNDCSPMQACPQKRRRRFFLHILLLGSFGLYQIGVFLLLGLLAMVPSMVSLSFNLNVGTPKHRCRFSENETFEKPSRLYEQFLQRLPAQVSVLDRQCMMFESNSSSNLVPCQHGYVFDLNKYGHTLSTELSLVCDRFHLRALTQNAFTAGTAGSLFTGLLSDRWGRRKTIYFLVILLIFALHTMQLFLYSTAHKLLIFTLCRFVQGFSITFYSVALVLLSELTGPTRRVLAANTLAYFYALGQIVLAITARHLKDYKLTYWALNIYLLPFVFVYVLIPESPRWLVQQNRVREARKVLDRMFQINRRSVEDRLELFYSHLPFDAIAAREAKQKVPTYLNVLKRLCRSKLMRKRCLLLIAVWAAALLVYLGAWRRFEEKNLFVCLGIGSALTSLTEHPHELLIAGAVSEMVGLSICHALASVVERRRLLIFFFVATAMLSALVPVTHSTETYGNDRIHSFTRSILLAVSLSLVLLGKLTTASCQLLIAVYATETYPTALRSTGVGLSACIARLVAMFGPQLSATQYSLWFPFPYIVYAVASTIAALAASQLPPIHAPCKLPETIHEVEKQHTPIPAAVPPPLKALTERRPSSALMRELGVAKPNPRVLSRRNSGAISLAPESSTVSRLPTITDMDEDDVRWSLNHSLFVVRSFVF